MTIFGVPWDDLDLTAIECFLANAAPEPLLWEAKGIEAKAGEVRRQVCGFANSHDGGYLIMGASQSNDGSWALDGIEFDDEPPIWVANVVGNGGVNPYPDGLDTRAFAARDGRQVAVVWVPPMPAPPCNTHGTVYERVSGRTISVREPLRLAQLFGRGDQARKCAHEKADAIARQMLVVGRNVRGQQPERIQFGIGVAAVGYLPDISSRLFSPAFDDRVYDCIGTLRLGPTLGGSLPVDSGVTQDARHFVLQAGEAQLGQSWAIRATWHGCVGVYWTQAVESVRVDSIVRNPVAHAWRVAEDLLIGLGAQSARYLQLAVAGWSFPANLAPLPPTVVGRGPLSPGVHDDVLDSIQRELRRAIGDMAYEDGEISAEA